MSANEKSPGPVTSHAAAMRLNPDNQYEKDSIDPTDKTGEPSPGAAADETLAKDKSA